MWISCSSLLLATLVITLALALAAHHLAKHHHTVAVHEGNTGKALAVLEGVADQWLLWLEAALSHLVGLQGVRVLHLLATSLLAHLPLQGGHTARCATASHKANGGVAHLDLVGDVQHLDLSIELLGLAQGGVLLVDHHVTRAGHVVLVKTLDVQAHVVARVGEVHTLVVHLHGEDLACAWVGGSVSGQEDHLLTRLHHALLDTSGKHITHTLDLVDAGDWHAHGGAHRTLRHTAHLVQHIVHGVNVDGLAANLNILTLPPAHVLRLLQQVVTHPAGDWHHRGALLNEVLLPANLHQHALHLVGNLVIPGLLVAGSVAVHLVHTNADLLHTQQVDKAGVLTSLSLDLTSLVVALGNGSGEVTISWHHDQCHISLGGTGNHVLDEVTVAWGIDDGVVPLLGEELLGGACNGHTTLTLLLLSVHEEGKCERALAQTLGFRLQLLQITLRQATQLKDQAAGGGALPTVDMAADHNGKVRLLRVGWHGWSRDSSFS
mmetsp:Transcript_76454/g.120632  ORF Transcript_76454/g.120632 Transcript_76454/m.120632 type:complete len:492 (-) Transcript_76454:62-1537(-)